MKLFLSRHFHTIEQKSTACVLLVCTLFLRPPHQLICTFGQSEINHHLYALPYVHTLFILPPPQLHLRVCACKVRILATCISFACSIMHAKDAIITDSYVKMQPSQHIADNYKLFHTFKMSKHKTFQQVKLIKMRCLSKAGTI